MSTDNRAMPADVTTGRPPARRCDSSDMLIVHRLFRRELTTLPSLVRSVLDMDVERARTVSRHAREIIDALDHHHHGEDELVWPKLRARAPMERVLVERMERQHAEVQALLGEVEPLLAMWTGTADPKVGAALAALLHDVTDRLVEHLDDEERNVLPLVERYLEKDEWAELAARGMAAIPTNRRVVFLAALLDGVGPTESKAFLAKVPLPGRIAYRLIGVRRHRAESERRRAVLLAAETGGRPTT